MAAPHRVRAALGEPNVVELALPKKLNQVAHCILDGHLGIDAGRHEHVDPLRAPERLERLVDAVAEVVGPVYHGWSESVVQDTVGGACLLSAYLPEAYRPSLRLKP